MSDLDEILSVHKGWYESNVGLVADTMLPYFPVGDGYHQFNLNGFTYDGVRDKHKLWVNLNKMGVDITAQQDLVGPDVQIFGDVALLTAEGVADLVMPTPSGNLSDSVPTRFRITEFFRRDDGEGNPVWKIWHMHVSPNAPEGSPKYGSE